MKSQETAVREFLRIRDELIHSTLDEIGQRLKLQGHSYDIVDDPIVIHPLLQTSYAALSLRVFVGDFDWDTIKGFEPINKIPFISFGFSLAELKVEVLVNPSSEGRYGSRHIRHTGRYQVEELTKEIIEEEVRQFLAEIPL